MTIPTVHSPQAIATSPNDSNPAQRPTIASNLALMAGSLGNLVYLGISMHGLTHGCSPVMAAKVLGSGLACQTLGSYVASRLQAPAPGTPANPRSR